MLEDAERRREAELKGNSRTFLIFIALPVIALLLGAAGLSIWYQAAARPVVVLPAPKRPVEASRPPVVELKSTADLDFFRPKAMRVENPDQPEESPKQGWQMVDKGDISFAMQLLNFLQPPAKKEDGNPR